MKMLVTTAIEKTWQDSDQILFLGEWCKLYDRKLKWEKIDHNVAPFHWDDREKFNKDYNYLELFHNRLLIALTGTLNSHHNVEHSSRYWQILLDPWLMSYVAVLFDHWECIRTLFENGNNNELVTILPNIIENIEPPFSYEEFANELLLDEWHYVVFSKIIEKYYKDKCNILRINFTSSNKVVDDLSLYKKISWKRSIINFYDYCAGKFIRKYKVVFLVPYFKLLTFIKINFIIGQTPRLFRNEFSSNNKSMKINCNEYEKSGRKDMVINMQTQSLFEEFVCSEILENIPSTLIEKYKILSDYVGNINIQTKVIITANSHWGDPIAKAWMAEQTNNKVKLIIAEHGGSFPAYKELFNFEENISDYKITWFKPYHKKHIRLPPSKLVSIAGWWTNKAWNHPLRSSCSIIGHEIPRYVTRAMFYPMASQGKSVFDLTMKFYENLSADIKKHVLVKPNKDCGWNSRSRFNDLLGKDRVGPAVSMSLSSIFFRSKIIVCTYPETTFSEAMASGVPTILFYSKEFNERNEVVNPLLKVLIESKIVFHDPNEAALHLNSIWHNPFQWWNSSQVINARNEFMNSALDLDKNWSNKWKLFLDSVT